MFNTPNSHDNPGSYVDLLKRMTQSLQEAKVGDQMLEIGRQIYETELLKQNIVLSRPEKERLFRQIMKVVLADALARIDGAK